MVNSFDLTNAARASGQGWVIRVEWPHIGGNTGNFVIDNVRVDHAAAATIMPASARDNGFAGFRRGTWRFVHCLCGHIGHCPYLNF